VLAGAGVVAAKAGDGQAAALGVRDDVGLPPSGRKFHHGVQPGGDAGHAGGGSGLAQRRHQLVAAPPVSQPGVPDLPVVAAGGDELGEGELADRVRAAA